MSEDAGTRLLSAENKARIDRAAKALYEDERSRAVDATQWNSWEDLNVAGKNWWCRRARAAFRAAFGGDGW